MQYLNYIFQWKSNHPYRAIWKRSQLLRDFLWAVNNWKHRQWCKYGKKHLLWLNTTDKYYDEMITKPLWPKYQRFAGKIKK